MQLRDAKKSQSRLDMHGRAEIQKDSVSFVSQKEPHPIHNVQKSAGMRRSCWLPAQAMLLQDMVWFLESHFVLETN